MKDKKHVSRENVTHIYTHEYLTNRKGITLVSLIITIIVMVILAGIALLFTIGEEGVIEKVQTSIKKHKLEQIQEEVKLKYAEEKSKGGKVIASKLAEKIEALSSEKYEEIQNIIIGNDCIYYTIELNDKEYKIEIENGDINEYVDDIDYYGKTRETLIPGDDFSIGTEKFKVFSKTDTEIKAMPYYNLKLDETPIKQVTAETADLALKSIFSTGLYWVQGQDEINMNDSKNNIQQYIIEYKNSLIALNAPIDIEVRAARYSELTEVGVSNSMRNPGQCDRFWTGSGYGSYPSAVWYVGILGGFNDNYGYAVYTQERGVRPIIIIPMK